MSVPPDELSIIGVTFKFGPTPDVIIRNDGVSFLVSSGSREAQQYTRWLAAGSITLPADGPSAETIAVTTAMVTRQATLTKVTTNFPTSWPNFETMVDQAIAFKIKTNAAWTANDSRDCCKLLVNIAMVCVAKLLVLIIERQDRR